MSYFSENYSCLTFPLAYGEKPGFREAQRGALFAIGSHFSGRNDPAIITMPTGTGKTAVLQASAFLLQANRVLVLTPSRLVREQIADDFKQLGVLKRLGAIPAGIADPKVMATTGRITDPAQWEGLREFDVVVATVPSVSPHIEQIPVPPPDLFDLILVDEAHHSPAASWTETLDIFKEARRVLFTATPFRRDDREILGRFAYTYDLKRAYQDGVFGHIQFQLVDQIPAGDNRQHMEDIATAKAAEGKLAADRAAGFDHLLMVRTDSKKRAAELVKLYDEHTALRLKLIQGNHSLGYVKRALAALAANELDGIICVNMLGEGFDMPRLKIAAVHSPHRSLAVTLQFIGRFARTAGERLGDATFLATASGVKVEAEKLYSAGAVWADIIPNLSAARVQREVEAREFIETFGHDMGTIPDLSDMSLYSLSPYAHVKIYRLREPFDINTVPNFGAAREQIFGRVSEDTTSSVYVTRMRSPVPWSTDEVLIDVEYDLFIFYFEPQSSLLFICASSRGDGLYRRVVRDLVGYDPKILGLSELNRALKDLEQARFYNVGMRNRQQSSLTESYRMLTGSHVDEAIRAEDARLFHRGHCFGSAIENGNEVTIGLSSASKIWSNTSFSLPELLGWCKNLARKILDERAAVTGSNLDLLQMGETVDAIPARVLWAEWDKDVYLDPPSARFEVGGRLFEDSLTQFSLEVERSDANGAQLLLEGPGLETRIQFRIAESPQFSYLSDEQTPVEVVFGRSDEDIVDYLNDNPLNLMLDDWSRVCGDEHFPAPVEPYNPFDTESIRAVDWRGGGVDITVEYADNRGRVIDSSIQLFLERELDIDGNAVVFWDHGSGEAADFIVLRPAADDGVDVTLYHCKGAGGPEPGNRVGDVYEVCAQAVKSMIWCDLPRLVDRSIDRMQRRKGVGKLVRGDVTMMRELATRRPVEFGMVVVQPGITKANVEPRLAEVLAAANYYLIRGGHHQLEVWGSA
ncbi:DEAD/DEAH box helicase [Bradyrhizobium sp. SZCCHNRI20481]|uniref:DEAD/DEAH box helicase n=1 Tax=Bradyrhizobium sp. SZCCHNRI20481 TaxID=3057286 RepID=UPI0029162264|nr:DEAD/DEAH box helicase family protein [Bradyrhizobium sp. SZCCHNRI20481]